MEGKAGDPRHLLSEPYPVVHTVHSDCAMNPYVQRLACRNDCSGGDKDRRCLPLWRRKEGASARAHPREERGKLHDLHVLDGSVERGGAWVKGREEERKEEERKEEEEEEDEEEEV